MQFRASWRSLSFQYAVLVCLWSRTSQKQMSSSSSLFWTMMMMSFPFSGWMKMICLPLTAGTIVRYYYDHTVQHTVQYESVLYYARVRGGNFLSALFSSACRQLSFRHASKRHRSLQPRRRKRSMAFGSAAMLWPPPSASKTSSRKPRLAFRSEHCGCGGGGRVESSLHEVPFSP